MWCTPSRRRTGRSSWRRSAVPAMRLADEIVVPSGYLVDVFRRFGLRARPIFNFVEVEAIPYRERGAPPRPVFFSNRNFEPLYNVACVGRVPPERMCRLYDEADIYLNSPDIDNMPNSIIEAFAAGLPVVTTNTGG